MYHKNQEPDIRDRVHLKCSGRKLVMEFVEYPLSWHREDVWRLIDLKTGEVFEESQILHDVLHKASIMTFQAFAEEGYVEASYMKKCAVRVVLQKKGTENKSILVQDIELNLDYSVESQILDFYEREWPEHEVTDFKWSEDLTAFSSVTIPLKEATNVNQ